MRYDDMERKIEEEKSEEKYANARRSEGAGGGVGEGCLGVI